MTLSVCHLPVKGILNTRLKFGCGATLEAILLRLIIVVAISLVIFFVAGCQSGESLHEESRSSNTLQNDTARVVRNVSVTIPKTISHEQLIDGLTDMDFYAGNYRVNIKRLVADTIDMAANTKANRAFDSFYVKKVGDLLKIETERRIVAFKDDSEMGPYRAVHNYVGFDKIHKRQILHKGGWEDSYFIDIDQATGKADTVANWNMVLNKTLDLCVDLGGVGIGIDSPYYFLGVYNLSKKQTLFLLKLSDSVEKARWISDESIIICVLTGERRRYFRVTWRVV